jgi:hypothetical protein
MRKLENGEGGATYAATSSAPISRSRCSSISRRRCRPSCTSDKSERSLRSLWKRERERTKEVQRRGQLVRSLPCRFMSRDPFPQCRPSAPPPFSHSEEAPSRWGAPCPPFCFQHGASRQSKTLTHPARTPRAPLPAAAPPAPRRTAAHSAAGTLARRAAGPACFAEVAARLNLWGEGAGGLDVTGG